MKKLSKATLCVALIVFFAFLISGCDLGDGSTSPSQPGPQTLINGDYTLSGWISIKVYFNPASHKLVTISAFKSIQNMRPVLRVTNRLGTTEALSYGGSLTMSFTPTVDGEHILWVYDSSGTGGPIHLTITQNP